MVKRGLALMLTGVILLTAFAACGGPQPKGGSEASTTESTGAQTINEAIDPYGKYEETVKIRVARPVEPTEKLPDGDTPENNQYTRYIKETLNIETETLWTASQGKDYDQKVNLAIASNDLPDAFVVNMTQFRTAVKSGQVQDMTEVYNKYASPKVKEMMDSSNGIAMKQVTIGGMMMAIPSLNVPDDGYSLMWIRKDWLDKLGLQVPKTVDELENVARAFVEQDPDGNGKADTIGITGPQNGGLLYANFLKPTNNEFGLDAIFSSYKAYPGFWINGSDGKAAYGSIMPETKLALTKLRDLYSKGLLDKQMVVRKDASEPVISGKSGIFFGCWWSGYWPLPDAVKNNPGANWQAYAAPLDADGVYNSHLGSPANYFCIVRKGYEHPEAAMKIQNINNRDSSKFDVSKGQSINEVLRCPMGPYDEVKVTLEALKDVLSGAKKPEDFDDPRYGAYKLVKGDVTAVKGVKTEPYDKMDIGYWNPAADMNNWPRLYSIMVGCNPIYDSNTKKNDLFSLVYSSTKTMESRWPNLQKLEDETFIKIIMGAAPVEAFDDFVTAWKAQGGDQITAEVQEISK